MAKTKRKSVAVKSDSKDKKLIEDTKEQGNNTDEKCDNSKPTKINLKRGKLPSNWNSYIDNNKSNCVNKNIPHKFPKSITSSDSGIKNVNIKDKKMETQTPSTTGRCIGIDCEMVGINESGRDHMLARVSLVDENGTVMYDTFVKQTQKVTDYRTAVSGVRPSDLINGRDFKTVQSEVNAIINGKVLVGHAVRNDLKVLFLNHNKKYIRDTSKYKKFRDENNGNTPSLKFLASLFLNLEIQTGEHSSIEDARAAMLLYMKFKNTWEADIRLKKYRR